MRNRSSGVSVASIEPLIVGPPPPGDALGTPLSSSSRPDILISLSRRLQATPVLSPAGVTAWPRTVGASRPFSMLRREDLMSDCLCRSLLP